MSPHLHLILLILSIKIWCVSTLGCPVNLYILIPSAVHMHASSNKHTTYIRIRIRCRTAKGQVESRFEELGGLVERYPELLQIHPSLPLAEFSTSLDLVSLWAVREVVSSPSFWGRFEPYRARSGGTCRLSCRRVEQGQTLSRERCL